MTTRSPLRVFFIVDGYTLKKANDYYRLYHPCHTPLDFRAIKNWARQEALRLFTPVSRYALMQCHYYHPYKDPQRYSHSHGISCFERELRYAGFQIHYSEQVGPDGVRPNMSLMMPQPPSPNASITAFLTTSYSTPLCSASASTKRRFIQYFSKPLHSRHS